VPATISYAVGLVVCWEARFLSLSQPRLSPGEEELWLSFCSALLSELQRDELPKLVPGWCNRLVIDWELLLPIFYEAVSWLKLTFRSLTPANDKKAIEKLTESPFVLEQCSMN